MTLYASPDVGFLLIGGRSVLGRVTDVSDSEEHVVEEDTPLGQAYDTWKAVGQSIWTCSQNGFYDSDSGAINEALALSGPQPMLFAPIGNSIGDPCVVTSGVRTTFEKGLARGQLHRANASYRTNTGKREGFIVAPLAARTSAGPTAVGSVDFGTAFANQETGKLVGVLQVTNLDLDGGTALVVTIRDSDDDITFADLIAFTNVTASPASEEVEQAAAASPSDIERYVEIDYEFTGGAGASRTATFAVGVARVL